MQRTVTPDQQPTEASPEARSRTRNLPVALILAGGLAAGVGLARPAGTDAGDRTGTASTGATGDTYRQGNRTAGDRGGGAETDTTITIEGFAYTGPSAVAPGTALTVTNRDDVTHTLSFRSNEADTGNVDGGASTTLTAPDAPGVYAYFCRIHPSMEGEIDITG